MYYRVVVADEAGATPCMFSFSYIQNAFGARAPSWTPMGSLHHSQTDTLAGLLNLTSLLLAFCCSFQPS